MMAVMAPLYDIESRYVSPRGTMSLEEHDEAVREHGLDGHATSACIIALRGVSGVAGP
jgi:hypothetical protein